ncbi:glycosyltransferase [Georgenia halophila]|uniref:Glycosyltransferase n=1 Tax=Georgenia halophila TaxID=620889 RepID=A0ABP8L2S8_9MICO
MASHIAHVEAAASSMSLTPFVTHDTHGTLGTSGSGTPEKFSVLMPVYAGDDPEHFRRAVRSATLEQTLRPDQLVVVRDGPVPASLARVIDELAAGGAGSAAGPVPATVVHLAKNRGLSHALEAGLRACWHDIVARADADDINVPERFSVQVPLVRAGADLVGSAITEFEEEGGPLGLTRRLPTEPEEIAAVARFRDPFNHPSVVYRRSAVVRAGGYRNLDLMEDYWLFVRMIISGAKVANVPHSLVLYRVGGGAYSRRGGLRLLRSEWHLQRYLHRERFIGGRRLARNLLVRGVYRLVPEAVRKPVYRSVIKHRGEGPRRPVHRTHRGSHHGPTAAPTASG